MENIRHEDFFNLKEFFYLLKRYIFLILFIIILFTAGAYIKAYFATFYYKTYSTIEIGEGSGNGGGGDILSQAFGVGGANEIDTDIALIKSRYIISNAIKNHNFEDRYFAVRKFRKFELYNDVPFKIILKKGKNLSFTIIPVNNTFFKLEVKKYNFSGTFRFGEPIKTKYFDIIVYKIKPFKYSKYIYRRESFISVVKRVQANLEVSRLGQKISMIKITYIDNVPQRDALITNLIAKTFIKDTIKQKTQQASQLLSFVTKQLNKITRELALSEIKLERFKKKTGIINIGLDSQMLLQKLSNVDSQLMEIKFKKETINFVINNLKKLKDIMLISAGAIDDKDIQQMIAQIQSLILKRNALLVEYTLKHPKVVAINTQIKDLKNIIFNRLYNLKRAIDKQYQFLLSIKRKYEKIIGTLPKNEKTLIDLERNYLVNKKIYQYLYEKKVSAEIAKAATISRNRIIDKALVPTAPFKPKKKTIIAIGFVLGLVVSIIIAIIIDFLNTKIKSVEEVEKMVKFPILGLIPHLKSKDIPIITSLNSKFAEAFRALRTNIEFIPIDNKSRIISITSTIDEEGKATIAANLGIVYSLVKKRTLIINLNMRKPILHEIFKIENDKGISNVLAGQERIEKVIKQTDKEDLYIIPSGPIPPNPAELIQSKHLKESLEYLKEYFDVIILDTPPIGVVVDAVHILKHSDVNLYVLRLNFSKKEFLKHIDKIVKFYKIKNIGLVINDIKDKSLYRYK